MHEGGETDVRGTYTVLAISSLLNMLTPELCEGVADFVLRCGVCVGHVWEGVYVVVADNPDPLTRDTLPVLFCPRTKQVVLPCFIADVCPSSHARVATSFPLQRSSFRTLC
jgi:hypothetical protein